jgi:hypothetical protein
MFRKNSLNIIKWQECEQPEKLSDIRIRSPQKVLMRATVVSGPSLVRTARLT